MYNMIIMVCYYLQAPLSGGSFLRAASGEALPRLAQIIPDNLKIA